MQPPIYHCPACWIDLKVIGRIARLRCPRCHALIAEGRSRARRGWA